jgi:hypothetical protein
MYASSPHWNADWMSQKDLESILSQLAGKIALAPYGPEKTALNYGLHFTGGEPFANFDGLCRAVEIAEELKIPSTFVETNCYWRSDDRTTAEKLRTLHNHFDNYGNYVPSFCAGISLGNLRELDRLLKDGVDTERYPVLGFLIDEDIHALFELARNLGRVER